MGFADLSCKAGSLARAGGAPAGHERPGGCKPLRRHLHGTGAGAGPHQRQVSLLPRFAGCGPAAFDFARLGPRERTEVLCSVPEIHVIGWKPAAGLRLAGRQAWSYKDRVSSQGGLRQVLELSAPAPGVSMGDHEQLQEARCRIRSLEQELAELRGATAALERNAQRDLAYRMSHDLRSPLTLILGHIQLLDQKLTQKLTSGVDPAGLRKHVDAICRAVARITSVLESLARLAEDAEWAQADHDDRQGPVSPE